VNGWCSAKWRKPHGIASVGTNPLLRNGRITSRMGVLLAVSTLSAASPMPTVSQVIANAMRPRRTSAISQCPGPASDR
jgi:hypothetical protein